MRRHPEAKWRAETDAIGDLVALQGRLLERVAQRFAEVGDRLAVGELDALRAAGFHDDPSRVATVKKPRAARLRQTGESAGADIG